MFSFTLTSLLFKTEFHVSVVYQLLKPGTILIPSYMFFILFLPEGELTQCKKERLAKLKLSGQFVPSCKVNGSY